MITVYDFRCETCGSAQGLECLSNHPRKTAKRYPVQPHKARRLARTEFMRAGARFLKGDK